MQNYKISIIFQNLLQLLIYYFLRSLLLVPLGNSLQMPSEGVFVSLLCRDQHSKDRTDYAPVFHFCTADTCQQPSHQSAVHFIHKARVQIPEIYPCHPLTAVPQGLADDGCNLQSAWHQSS